MHAARLVALSLGLCACAGFGAVAQESRGPFTVETLAPGVHLFRPTGETGERTNSLVVVRQDGLLIVDAQPNPAAAKELLAAVARVSTLPVRYLVYTHPHADAAGGASAFPDATLVIGSVPCRFAMADPAYDFAAEQRRRARDPGSVVEPPRRLPTLVLEAPTALEDPVNRVLLVPVPVPKAHSRGDLMVSLPDLGILAVGDLVTAGRNPYPVDGNLNGWMVVLNDIENQGAKRLVPVRGPTLEPREALVLRDSLLWVKGQIAQLYVDRVPPGIMPDRVLEIPGASKYFDLAASPSYLRDVAEAVVREAQAERKRRGLD